MYIGQMTRKRGAEKRKFKYNPNVKGNYHWTYVMRYPNATKRKKIAEGMELAIKKKKYIKYSNGSKSTKVYDYVKTLKWNIGKIAKKTYTNCCVLASVACRYAGIATPKKSSSLTLHKKWTKYGFKRIKYKKGMKLYRGDILVCTTKYHPHTAVVL